MLDTLKEEALDAYESSIFDWLEDHETCIQVIQFFGVEANSL